jgi:CRP-like cAMP-binding protein
MPPVAPPYHELIGEVTLFQGLSPRTLERIRAAHSPRTLEPDTVLFRQGEPAERLYLLAEGRLRVGQLTEDGRQITMRIITPGRLCGGVAVLGAAHTYPVSATAMERCVALGWNGEQLRSLARDDPGLGLNMAELMYGHVEEIQTRLSELATERVDRRIARALIRLAAQTGKRVAEGVLIDLPLTRQELAEMTGTTLYTVSRVLSQWDLAGLVRAGRGRVVLTNPHGLVVIAQDVGR